MYSVLMLWNEEAMILYCERVGGAYRQVKTLDKQQPVVISLKKVKGLL